MAVVLLDRLRDLYNSMRAQSISRYRFSYKRGALTFDVMFLIDETPYALLFGAQGHNLSFEFQVQPGFRVVHPQLDKADYAALCRLLDLKWDPNNSFSPGGFLADFNPHIPATAVPSQKAGPHHVAQVRRNVEDAHKRFFCGWRDNKVRGERVTAQNLKKTRELMGPKTADTCQQKNISSCWTDIPGGAVAVTDP